MTRRATELDTGIYTAFFLLSATFMFFSRRPRRWSLLPLNMVIYLLSTATLYYDLVMTCVSVETDNAVRLYRIAQGGDPKFLRTRISLFILISCVPYSLRLLIPSLAVDAVIAPLSTGLRIFNSKALSLHS
jgi:hypothetical protein